MRVGITGAEGLLGRHLRAFLRTRNGVEVVCAGRATFANGKALETFVSGCDAIVHFAGMNRGDEAEVANTNVRLARELVDACTAAGAKPQIIFSSSTHIHRDTPYGASKRACTEILGAWAERAGAPFYNLVLPGVFGEGGKPFYNSVVSTFCHQLAKGEQPTIQQNAAMRQVHAQEVARWIDAALTARSFGQFEPEGTLITVEELLNRLREFDAKYRQHIIPDVRSPFDLDLFNTYRSYLYPDQYPRQLKLHEDPRGSSVRGSEGAEWGPNLLVDDSAWNHPRQPLPSPQDRAIPGGSRGGGDQDPLSARR